MALVGYDPLPNGGYRFHRDDGQSMAFVGPEADSLKSWIDQTRGPDARTASNDSRVALNPDGSLPGPGQMGGRAAPMRTDASPAPPEAPKPAGPTWDQLGQFDAKGNQIGPPVGVQAPAAPMDFGPPAAQQTPAQSARVASSPPVPPGAPPGPRPQAASPGRVEAPGKPGEIPPTVVAGAPEAKAEAGAEAMQDAIAQATKKQTGSGGASKSTLALVERSVEGAHTPEENAENLKMLQAQRAADDASMAKFTAAAEQEQAAYGQQAVIAQHQAETQQEQLRAAEAKRIAIEDAYNKKQASLQSEQDAVTNQKVDPKRLFSGDGGTLYAITSTLAVALGAFGASMTGGPNYAQQIVNASIQRDIDAQYDAIKRKGENANNAMSNFMRAHGMDVDEARAGVKAIAQQYAGTLANQQALKIGGPAAAQKAAELQAKMQAESNKSLAEFQNLVRDKETQKYKATGGGGGAFKWVMGEDGVNRLFNLKTGKIEQETRDGHAYNTGNDKGGGETKAGDVTPRLSSSEAAAEAAGPGLDHLERLIRSGDRSSIGQWMDSFGVGAKSPITIAAENQAYISARAETGGMVPPHEREEQIKKNLMSPSKETALAQIAELRAAKAAIHNSNVSVSAKTAKVGTIDGSGQVDSSGGGG